MSVHLRTKFQISSITLNSFREGRRCNTPPPPPTPHNRPLKSPPRLRLNSLSRKFLILLFLFAVLLFRFRVFFIFVDQQYLHFKNIELFKLFLQYSYCRVELSQKAKIFSHNNIF